MKAKLTILISVIFMIMTGCVPSQMVTGGSVSVFTEIPLAPNVVLTVEAPVIMSPGPGYIWVDGHWTWDPRIRGYVWVQGFWALVPFQGAFWTPGFWESYRGGYRWVDARWWPRNQRFTFGFQSNRFDYFGRPVYFSQPQTTVRTGYAFTYDNRPETRGRGYSSSPSFNDAPRSERTRLTREFERTANTSVRSVGTERNRQDVIRIRENDNQGTRESTTTRQATPTTTTRQTTSTPTTTTTTTRQTTPTTPTTPTRQSGTQEDRVSSPATTTPSRTQTPSTPSTPSRTQQGTQENRAQPATTPSRTQTQTQTPSRTQAPSSESSSRSSSSPSQTQTQTQSRSSGTSSSSSSGTGRR